MDKKNTNAQVYFGRTYRKMLAEAEAAGRERAQAPSRAAADRAALKMAVILLRMTDLAAAENDLETAVGCCRRALSVAASVRSPQYDAKARSAAAAAYEKMGGLALLSGHPDRAEACCRRGLAFCETESDGKPGSTDFTQALCFLILGHAAMQRHSYEEAGDYYSRCLLLGRRNLGTENELTAHRCMALSYYHIGEADMELGRMKAARENIYRGLGCCICAADQEISHALLWEKSLGYACLGCLEERRHNPSGAASLYRSSREQLRQFSAWNKAGRWPQPSGADDTCPDAGNPSDLENMYIKKYAVFRRMAG